MGYRKYAKDYEIEYVDRIGKTREKAVRIYVGPYFRFIASPEQIRRLRLSYLVLILLAALLLVVPMCIDCAFTRTWYIQIPAAAAWIPWVFSAGALWRLWTAGEKVEREHYDMLYGRMSGASVFIMIFSAISIIGCAALLIKQGGTGRDIISALCCVGVLVCSSLMFSKRNLLKMSEEENPEKPQAKKSGQ